MCLFTLNDVLINVILYVQIAMPFQAARDQRAYLSVISGQHFIFGGQHELKTDWSKAFEYGNNNLDFHGR